MGRVLTWQAVTSAGEVVAGDYRFLERSQIAYFDVLLAGQTVLRLDVRPDSSGVKRWFWRLRHRLDSNGQAGEWALVGWSRADQDAPQVLAHVFTDGSMLLGTAQNGDVVQDPITFFPWE